MTWCSYYKINITRKTLTSGGVSLRLWHQLSIAEFNISHDVRCGLEFQPHRPSTYTLATVGEVVA